MTNSQRLSTFTRSGFLRQTEKALTVLLLLVLTFCSTSGEEPEKKTFPPNTFYSEMGKQVLRILDEPYTINSGENTLVNIENQLTFTRKLVFAHSEKAAALLEQKITIDADAVKTIEDLLKHLEAIAPVKTLVEYDGTILVYHNEDADSITTSKPEEDFNNEVLESDTTWRVKLSYDLNGRVSLGHESHLIPLTKLNWRFRYCPILSPHLSLENVRVNRIYLHEPLKDVLKEVLEMYQLRYVPWGGVIVVLPKNTPPGLTPNPPTDECWTAADSPRGFRTLMETTIDTSLLSPRTTEMADVKNLAEGCRFKLVFASSAVREKFRGIPAGEIKLKYLLALLKNFDELDAKMGPGWVLLYKNTPPQDLINELNSEPQYELQVGQERPKDGAIETPSFAELSETEMKKLREMSVNARLCRKVVIDFNKIPLKKAIRKLEYMAYFHFKWEKESEEIMAQYSVNGYFEQYSVEDILRVLCANSNLMWYVEGAKPVNEEYDRRFFIVLKPRP